MSKKKNRICRLCGKKILENMLSRHHLIPKDVKPQGKGGNTIPLHRMCHLIIHTIFTNEELALYYNHTEKMKENITIKRFIRFIHNTPTNFYLENEYALRTIREIKKQI